MLGLNGIFRLFRRLAWRDQRHFCRSLRPPLDAALDPSPARLALTKAGILDNVGHIQPGYAAFHFSQCHRRRLRWSGAPSDVSVAGAALALPNAVALTHFGRLRLDRPVARRQAAMGTAGIYANAMSW